jgi:hypothetical protein
MPPFGSHFVQVCAAGITGLPLVKTAQIPSSIVNAFLTLSAVTKW